VHLPLHRFRKQHPVLTRRVLIAGVFVVCLGAGAAVIGEVRAEPEGLVLLETSFGGSRIVDMLVGDPLPRIC